MPAKPYCRAGLVYTERIRRAPPAGASREYSLTLRKVPEKHSQDRKLQNPSEADETSADRKGTVQKNRGNPEGASLQNPSEADETSADRKGPVQKNSGNPEGASRIPTGASLFVMEG